MNFHPQSKTKTFTLKPIGGHDSGWECVDLPELFDSTIVCAGFSQDTSFADEFAKVYNGAAIIIDPFVRHPDKLTFKGTTIEKALWHSNDVLDLVETQNGNAVSHKVEAITFEEALQQAKQNPQDISLVKLDLRGAETEIISSFLRDGITPPQILVTFDKDNTNDGLNGHDLQNAQTLLEKHNYKCVKQINASNFLFIQMDHFRGLIAKDEKTETLSTPRHLNQTDVLKKAHQESVYLYYGNLGQNEKQYQNEKFIGLCIYPSHDREINHNALAPLPFDDNCIEKIQSQDVFEHLPYDELPGVLNEIYRVLKPGGTFRLSVPDYRSPLLRKRSIYDDKGNVLGDIMTGAQALYNQTDGGIDIQFRSDGNDHLWFPTYELVLNLIVKSTIRKSQDIVFYQYFQSDEIFFTDPIPENEMHVIRALPQDNRANGKPISIVVDFVK